MNATTVAVDLAKDVFEVALVNRGERIFERKRLTRPQFERFLDGLNTGNRDCHGGVWHAASLGAPVSGAASAGPTTARTVRPAVRPP